MSQSHSPGPGRAPSLRRRPRALSPFLTGGLGGEANAHATAATIKARGHRTFKAIPSQGLYNAEWCRPYYNTYIWYHCVDVTLIPRSCPLRLRTLQNAEMVENSCFIRREQTLLRDFTGSHSLTFAESFPRRCTWPSSSRRRLAHAVGPQIGDPHHRVGLPDSVLAGTATRTVGRSLDIVTPDRSTARHGCLPSA